MKKQIIISLILVTFWSCTKTIKFDDEGLANQVVVSSFISTESYFSSYITKSGSILEDRQNNSPIEGSMDLYEDGTLIRQFPSQLGGFSATDIIPQAGKTYRMVISSNGKTLETETIIPQKVEVISVDTTSAAGINNERYIGFNIKIKDPEGDDYYRIVHIKESIRCVKDEKGTRKYYRSSAQSGIRSGDPVFKSVYNNFGDEIIGGPDNEYYIFPDNYFNGKEYTIKFRTNPDYTGNVSYPSNYGYGGGYGTTTQIYERNDIHIQKLSKDLYNYLKYLKLYNFYHDNPFSEPVPIYSNIKNGIGIFAGFNDETKLVYEKIFVPFSMDTIKLEEGSYGY
ncbi:MAG TPA: DUF4249 domain-containing protein [Prolixibacteraceae bacterium]